MMKKCNIALAVAATASSKASVHRPTSWQPCSSSSLAILPSSGGSAMQGLHQVPQQFTMVTLALEKSSALSTALPSKSVVLKVNTSPAYLVLGHSGAESFRPER